MKAIIGGTGFDTLDGIALTQEYVDTPYGQVELFRGEGLIFLPRHGSNHHWAPHLIPYRANVMALHQLGVKEVIAIYAVGSIDERLKPGQVGIVSDFVDLTGRAERHTFYENPVRHIEVDQPFNEELIARLKALKPDLVDAGVYVTTNGPRLETKAEINLYRNLGFSVVGMTLASEVSLLLEAEMHVAALAYSINWAAGVEKEFSFLPDEQLSELKASVTQLCQSCLLS